MPERWEMELRKLREVRPAADLDARVEEGPRGAPPSSRSRRAVAAVTGFAVFAAAAGAFAFVVLREDGSGGVVGGEGDEPRLVLELVSTENAPTASLRYGDERVDVVTEGYEWCDGDVCASMISDFAFYPPVGEYLVVPPGTPIEVTGDGTVDSFRVTDPDDEPIPGATELVVPSTNGRYVFAITGSFERGEGFFFFGVQAIDSPASAPDVLHVDCSAGTTRIDSSIVRTQADGLHVQGTGMQGWDGLEIVTPAGTPPDEVSAVGDIPADGATGWPIAPGRWEIACASTERPVEAAGASTVPLELVDPDDHWAPVELDCSPGSLVEATETSSWIPSSVPHEAAAARVLDGLQEGDRIRGAGYGAETWLRGFTYVVDRDGRAVAELVLSPLETYGVRFSACPDSGIRLASTEDIPNVLIVRCEGLGPAVDSSRVRLQPDGLHIEASNIADATIVDVWPAGSAVSLVQTPFLSVTERFVVDVEPGVVSIGCRVQDETGSVVGGPDEVPDAYVEVGVLPVE